eukprot:CAMPEP_0116054894 /NCGR_PEP_ID=MMETSP0322-20121206/3083_1 /TAXON_ID=163516 /ORGANISM="Leptocylindrus danicus var. apora, Strain B651" /LENGTH=88 /DNA_ID=CAMNT_0003538393 /DNA_START=174 /DNA_END=437 /DNA_ORIENTATION=-
MRRGYTFDSYMRIINKIKTQAPDASICGDVIVGFPGESEEAFQRTLDLMEAQTQKLHFGKIRSLMMLKVNGYKNCNVFPFSMQQKGVR